MSTPGASSAFASRTASSGAYFPKTRTDVLFDAPDLRKAKSGSDTTARIRPFLNSQSLTAGQFDCGPALFKTPSGITMPRRPPGLSHPTLLSRMTCSDCTAFRPRPTTKASRLVPSSWSSSPLSIFVPKGGLPTTMSKTEFFLSLGFSRFPLRQLLSASMLVWPS